MKTVLKISLVILLVISAVALYGKDRPKESEPVSAKNKNLFVFKANRKLVGAKVEILQADGSIISEQVLVRRKMIIDFNDMKENAYTIRLKKGDEVKEFQYKRK